MRAIFILLVFYFSLFTEASAQSGLNSALYARSLLGPDVWTRVVRIQNSNARSVYPRDFYAVIFEFAGILWFYTERDGTQSLSLYENRLEQEKENFRPGLLDIDRGFTSYSLVSDAGQSPNKLQQLPNGCFIESLIAGRTQLSGGERIHGARLVMLYPKQRHAGHCVLAFETEAGVFVLDPIERKGPRRVGDRWPQSLTEIASIVWSRVPKGELGTVRTVDFPTLREKPSVSEALLASSPERGRTSEPGDALPGHG